MSNEKLEVFYEVFKEEGHFLVRYRIGIKGLYNTVCECGYKHDADNICYLLNDQQPLKPYGQ